MVRRVPPDPPPLPTYVLGRIYRKQKPTRPAVGAAWKQGSSSPVSDNYRFSSPIIYKHAKNAHICKYVYKVSAYTTYTGREVTSYNMRERILRKQRELLYGRA